MPEHPDAPLAADGTPRASHDPSDSPSRGATPPGTASGHIVLVGLPGAGKSTIGRAVAKRLGRPFVDFDLELEHREGQSVSALFATRGEAAFRALEADLTAELVSTTAAVWAPGGGWITNPGVLALVRPPGRIIHLKVSPAGALQRLGSARASRPLLMESDPGLVLDRLWERRQALYALADAEVDTEAHDFKRVTHQVFQLARGFGAGKG